MPSVDNERAIIDWSWDGVNDVTEYFVPITETNDAK
jgi:hypothetical protein